MDRRPPADVPLTAVPVYAAFLRAVNVGGTGKLPMAKLRTICAEAGLQQARTYIASGNVVFRAPAAAEDAKAALESRLADYVGKPVPVFIRDRAQMRAILDANPFAAEDPSRVAAVFLDAAPPPDALEAARGRNDEDMALGAREIYVHYPSGMGRSKLKIPAAQTGTARNMNTVAALLGMMDEG